jgi:cell division protein FtsI/penicillin-binding protein 2
LIGYSDQPTMLQLVGYMATLAAIIITTRLVTAPKQVAA